MLQTRTTRWAALTACACIAVLAVAWLTLISPKRAEAADIQDQASAARAQNDTLEVKIAQLRAQFATLSQDKADLAQVYVQMPKGAQTPELVRNLDAMASQSGVVLKSITPGEASYLAPATGTAASAAGSTGSAGSSGSAGATGTNPATGTGSAAAGSAGVRVVAIPVVIAVHGDYFQTVLFLKKLQMDLPRAFLVTGLQVNQATGAATTGAGTGVVDLSITGKVFALPDPTTASGSAAGGTNGTGQGGAAPTTPGSGGSTTARTPATSVTTTSFTAGDAAGQLLAAAGNAPVEVSRAGAGSFPAQPAAVPSHRVSEDS